MLVIDDLHAADTPSLLLLRFLARELRDARIVLVAAYRDTESGPHDPLSVTVAELRREPIARLVRLGGLDLPEVARCIELIAGTTPRRRARRRDPRRDGGEPAVRHGTRSAARAGATPRGGGPRAVEGKHPSGDARGDRASPAAPIAGLQAIY